MYQINVLHKLLRTACESSVSFTHGRKQIWRLNLSDYSPTRPGTFGFLTQFDTSDKTHSSNEDFNQHERKTHEKFISEKFISSQLFTSIPHNCQTKSYQFLTALQRTSSNTVTLMTRRQITGQVRKSSFSLELKSDNDRSEVCMPGARCSLHTMSRMITETINKTEKNVDKQNAICLERPQVPTCDSLL